MTRWFWILVLAAGCAAETDGVAGDEPLASEDDGVAVIEQTIFNGSVFTDEEYTGIIALQVWSTTVNNWFTFCSGTLMTNNKAITAEHCMTADVQGRQIYAKMGSQRVPVVAQALNHTWDIAVIKFGSAMRMWNWSNDHYLTSPAQATTSGYARGAYGGTNASLNGQTMLCWGHGGASTTRPQPPLTYAFMQTKWGDGFNPTNMPHVYKNGSNQIQEGGDSGGPCFPGLVSSHQAQLAFVLSGCFYGSFNFCYGGGAESWAGWAYLTLLAI